MMTRRLIITLKVILTAVMIGIGLSGLSTPIHDGEESHTFHQKRIELEAALSERNFVNARNILDELYPMMKKEIKMRKKQLAQAQKNDLSPDEVAALTQNLIKKVHLYDSIKSLDATSPSALRVRSTRFRTMIEKYGELVKII